MQAACRESTCDGERHVRVEFEGAHVREGAEGAIVRVTAVAAIVLVVGWCIVCWEQAIQVSQTLCFLTAKHCRLVVTPGSFLFACAIDVRIPATLSVRVYVRVYV